jgi:hypothetical protein
MVFDNNSMYMDSISVYPDWIFDTPPQQGLPNKENTITMGGSTATQQNVTGSTDMPI